MNDIDNANDIDMILINYCVLALLLYMLTITVSFQKQIVLLLNNSYITHTTPYTLHSDPGIPRAARARGYPGLRPDK